MYGLDLINTSVLGALGCDMNTFLRYFPAAKTMYNGSLSAPLLILTALLLCAGITAAVLILLRRRRNVYVYVPGSSPREYRLIAKFRVEPDSEVPAIDAGSLALNPGDTVAVEVKKSLARHLAGREFTVSFPQSDHTYTIQASKHNDWHEFTVPAEEEQEAPV